MDLVEIAKIAVRPVFHGTDTKSAKKILRRGFNGGPKFDGHVWTSSELREPQDIAEVRSQLRKRRGSVVESWAWGKPADAGRHGHKWALWKPEQLQPVGTQMTKKHAQDKAQIKYRQSVKRAQEYLDRPQKRVLP